MPKPKKKENEPQPTHTHPLVDDDATEFMGIPILRIPLGEHVDYNMERDGDDPDGACYYKKEYWGKLVLPHSDPSLVPPMSPLHFMAEGQSFSSPSTELLLELRSGTSVLRDDLEKERGLRERLSAENAHVNDLNEDLEHQLKAAHASPGPTLGPTPSSPPTDGRSLKDLLGGTPRVTIEY